MATTEYKGHYGEIVSEGEIEVGQESGSEEGSQENVLQRPVARLVDSREVLEFTGRAGAG